MAGLQDQGGVGTYYPATIYNAAEYLLNQQNTRDSGSYTTQNAMIILGDGTANATSGDLAAGATNGGTYPSWNNQCQQAIAAAQWAQSEGISIYSVSYDAPTSGCSDVAPYSNPCYTMQQLARTGSTASAPTSIAAPSKFFTSNSGCTETGGNTVESLNSIFTAIATGICRWHDWSPTVPSSGT